MTFNNSDAASCIHRAAASARHLTLIVFVLLLSGITISQRELRGTFVLHFEEYLDTLRTEDKDGQEEKNMEEVRTVPVKKFISIPVISFEESTLPDKNLPAIALEILPTLGLRNECQALTYFVMEAMARKMPQILLESIAMKDTFGIFRRWVPFEKVFDVVHWNSYYPALPRLVRFDPDIHPQWPVPSELRNKTANHTPPYAFPGIS
jgi:hypothetical protein